MNPNRTVFMRSFSIALLACAVALSGATAQSPAAPVAPAQRTSLTLSEALQIAERNNPTYQQSINGRSRARAGVRTAYGTLFPSIDASVGAGYREGRQQFFGGVPIGSVVDIVSSSWGIQASTRYAWGTVSNIKRANAQLDAAEADLSAALFALRSSVSTQYLLALQTQARAALQDTLVVQQRLQLELARARAGVGAATSLDTKRAEVGLGQQEVAALRARNTAEVARLQLFQQLGVAMPEGVVLTADLPVTQPTFELNDLLTMARRDNPALRAVIARQRVADAGVASARGEYTPTLSLSGSIGGNAQAPADSAFPTDFVRNPYNLSASISIPIFDGLAREQRLQEANATRTDAEYSTRRQELTLTADVTSAHVTLLAAHRAVELQTRTAATSREALQLAEERYRVGANTFVDLTTARAEYERAETDRIDAVYEFHRAFAALESAVGRTLR
jgi:outer membrane protein